MVALGEWLMVLPAAVFLAAAAMRPLQPRQYEPARTSWIVFEFAITHISQFGAAILLVGLPALVAVAGCAILFDSWRRDQALRHDVSLAFALLRRNLAIGLLISAALLGGAILAFSVTHVLTD